MKRKRFSEEQIHAILKGTEAGIPAVDVCRKHGVHVTTFSRWKAKYGGMELSDLRKLKQLEDENLKLKRLVAEKELDIQALKLVVEKKW